MPKDNARIRRGRVDRNFTSIPNLTLADARIGFDSLGALVYLLMHTRDWECRVSDLSRRNRPGHKGGGRDACRRMLRELRNAGYVSLITERHPDGHIERVYLIYADPRDNDTPDGSEVRINAKGEVVAVKPGKPATDNPALAFPALEKPGTGNTAPTKRLEGTKDVTDQRKEGKKDCSSSNSEKGEASPPVQTPPTLQPHPQIAPVAPAAAAEKEPLTEEQERIRLELVNWGVDGAEEFCRYEFLTKKWLNWVVERGRAKPDMKNLAGWIRTAIDGEKAKAGSWKPNQSIGGTVADPRVVEKANALPDVIWERARTSLIARLESHFSTEPCGDRRALVERVKATPPRECCEVRRMITDAIAAGHFKQYFEDNEAN